MKIGKKEAKLSLIEDMSLYMGNPRESTEVLRVNKQVEQDYMLQNIQKSIVMNNSEVKLRKQFHFLRRWLYSKSVVMISWCVISLI